MDNTKVTLSSKAKGSRNATTVRSMLKVAGTVGDASITFTTEPSLASVGALSSKPKLSGASGTSRLTIDISQAVGDGNVSINLGDVDVNSSKPEKCNPRATYSQAKLVADCDVAVTYAKAGNRSVNCEEACAGRSEDSAIGADILKIAATLPEFDGGHTATVVYEALGKSVALKLAGKIEDISYNAKLSAGIDDRLVNWNLVGSYPVNDDYTASVQLAGDQNFNGVDGKLALAKGRFCAELPFDNNGVNADNLVVKCRFDDLGQ